jgi:hypothetical protein
MSAISVHEALRVQMHKFENVRNHLQFNKNLNLDATLKAENTKSVSVVSIMKMKGSIQNRDNKGWLVFNNDWELLYFIDCCERNIKEGLMDSVGDAERVYDVEYCIDSSKSNNFNRVNGDKNYYSRVVTALNFMTKANPASYKIFELNYDYFIESISKDRESGEFVRDSSEGKEDKINVNKSIEYYLKQVENSWNNTDMYYGSFDIMEEDAKNAKLRDFIVTFLTNKYMHFNSYLAKFQHPLDISLFKITNYFQNNSKIYMVFNVAYSIKGNIITNYDYEIDLRLDKLKSDTDEESILNSMFKRELEYLLMKSTFQFGSLFKHLFVDQSFKLIIDKFIKTIHTQKQYAGVIKNPLLKTAIFNL